MCRLLSLFLFSQRFINCYSSYVRYYFWILFCRQCSFNIAYRMYAISIFLPYYINVKSSSECTAQRQVLHCKRRNQAYSSVWRQVFHRKLRNQGLIVAVAFRCFPHPTLSLVSEQNLKRSGKYPRGNNVQVRRVDLDNWALRTSPKFTTRLKYQFRKSFWPSEIRTSQSHFTPAPLK